MFVATAALVVAVSPAVQAEVKLHQLFTDNAVLQQDKDVPIWGTANDGEEVKISLTTEGRGPMATTTAKDGKWLVKVGKLKAGGPYELTVEGKSNKVTSKNILVGEVWVCGGQSNMEWTVNGTADAAQVKENAKNSSIRRFKVPHRISARPETTVEGRWEVASPQTVGGWTAVGYAFGKALATELKVPVGLIDDNWGGTIAEAWMPEKHLADNPQLKSLLKPIDGKNPNVACGLYNGMIHPILPYAIRGAIWYQGESNAGRAYQYRTLFPLTIQSWRDSWNDQDMPFFFVQLAPWRAIVQQPGPSDWAELREAQLLTSQKVKNTAEAVITDLGDEKDIHPKQKTPVGQRLALAALALTYGKKIEYSGPVYESMKVDGDKAVLSFTHLGGGLVCKGEKLTGFAIAGEDQKFVNADAVIKGDTVVVSSPMVAKPVAVRFGWANYPVVNLFNKEGLPATPFRTDEFPGVTQPKQPKQ
jgi:sialate O-acetylesterase